MKNIYINGKVYTEKGKFAEGFIVENGVFTRVGSTDDILSDMEEKNVVDLKGKTVIPGINDSHAHLFMLAKSYREVYLLGVESIDEVIEKSKQFIEDNPEVKAVYGMGWNKEFFTSGEIRDLTRDDLDLVSLEIPVVLRRACGHMLSANSKAIEMSGVNENTVIPGGDFDYEKGHFFENACNPLIELIPEPTDEELIVLMKRAMKDCMSKGITTVQVNECTTSGSRESVVNTYRDLFKKEENLVRIHHQIFFDSIEEFDDFLNTEKKDPVFNTLMQDIGPMKLFKDGSLGARSALVKEEYLDSKGNTGIKVLSDEDCDKFLKFAYDNNLQVVTHVIGDRGLNEMVKDYSKYTGEDNPLRWGIIHTQLSDREDLDLIKKYNIATLVQPIFLRADIVTLKKAVSEKLQSTSYAFGTMVREGIHMSFGTDTPVEEIDPFNNIYWAVARKKIGDKEAFFEKECVGIEDAIDAYTIESAYIEFKEDFKGRIKEGYLADFVVLDRDIFTIETEEIPDVKVLETFINGKKVYQLL
ncbi:MAG: amidohydrolase [Clostridiales bacterium]|nr:MAG: amidohydrolase [Clostridiales bacterium]